MYAVKRFRFKTFTKITTLNRVHNMAKKVDIHLPMLMMVPSDSSSTIQGFIHRLQTDPTANLDDVLHTVTGYETHLRRLFATDRDHPEICNPYVGLIEIFNAPQAIRTVRARTYATEEERCAKYIIPVSQSERRSSGMSSTVPDLQSFLRRWDAFSQGLLSNIKCWDNVIAAGGSVLACLSPLRPTAEAQVTSVSRRALTDYFMKSRYGKSDIDLFIWGMTGSQAKEKINQIFLDIRDAIPLDVVCVRTRNVISIHSVYPYRPIQIVLRLYKSPAEVLAGFDVDSACVAYDGSRVWASPRAVVALMRQANTVDMSRRSPSYEARLAKYAERGFEVYYSGLRRQDIDPMIYHTDSLRKAQGLARLLILEDKPTRLLVEDSQNVVYSGDRSKDDPENEYLLSNYEIASFRVPHGPQWSPVAIQMFIRQVDKTLNCPYTNSSNRLHRHVAFCARTAVGVMEGMCELCEQATIDLEDEILVKEQKENDKKYVRGHLQFMSEDPGRQLLTGSFNPIDVGEWSQGAYKDENLTSVQELPCQIA